MLINEAAWASGWPLDLAVEGGELFSGCGIARVAFSFPLMVICFVP
jgi:hypothetical protein